MKRVIVLIGVLALSVSALASPVLSVYVWSSSLPSWATRQFTKETGIPVSVSYYDSNEALYAKLKGNPGLPYDVVFPSSYFIGRMVKAHLLQPFQKHLIPNAVYLDKHLLNQGFDRDNHYSYPFMYGITGIAVNDQYIKPSSITRWKDFWSPRFKRHILWLNDVREVFAIALIRLGYSINDRNHEHIKQAYELLKKALPNVKVINSDAMQSMFIDEDVTIGLAWALSAYEASQSNAHIRFVIPRDRFALWLDCMAVAKGSRHPRLAATFINFLMRPDVAEHIMRDKGVSMGNLGALPLLPKKLRDNPMLNPPPSLVARGEIQDDVGEARKWYARYWLKLRLSVGDS